MSQTTIHQVLRDTIRESGLTHYRLSQLSGVAAAVIDRFVIGDRDIYLATASKLARALGLDLRKSSKKTKIPALPS